METEKILHLSLAKKWFDMIASGKKTEEYREIKKYWLGRLFNFVPTPFAKYVFDDIGISPKPFTHVLFRNGYGDDKASMKFKIKSITIGEGNPTLGAPSGKDVFIIKFEQSHLL